MANRPSPADYEAWYAAARGAWMGNREAETLIRLGGIRPGDTLLDVGCGSGWFTRRFAAAGCEATGLDSDLAMLDYARTLNGAVQYLQGDMLDLPLPDKSFNIVASVTSLCFVADEHKALSEMVRVARRCVLLGLLHRRSLLYLYKGGRGAYVGAHWHTRAEIRSLLASVRSIRDYQIETLLFWPGKLRMGRLLEQPPLLRRRYGGFMAVRLTL